MRSEPDDTLPPEAAERLRLLWSEGRRPEVDALLATAGPLPPDEIAAVLRVDQRARWQTAERVWAEDYLRRHPALLPSTEAVVDLIYAEFLLREQLGERPNGEDYLRRFPEHAGMLRGQLELHRALTAGVAGDTQTAPEPAASTVSVSSNEMFGRYRILGRLGEGGMATVHLAHDTRLDRRVALKVPHFRSDDSSASQRFYREAQIAAGFTHPNLCRVYDVGEVNGVPYLTMPVVEGESLSACLTREGPLPEEVAARLAVQIAEALAVAHAAGVIHRDLKPGNILLTPAREPVVMDFGLACRAIPVEPRLTMSGAILGTPGYCAPEQIGVDLDQLGPACDVYGLGATLYEMLTGRPPFDGPPGQALQRTLVGNPVLPSRHRPGLDPRLDAICRTALAREPDKRFASTTAFAGALRDYLGTRPRPSRRFLLLAAFTASAILVSGLGAWALWPQPTPTAPTVDVDPLRAGSHWVGRYQFEPPFEELGGPVEIEVTRRAGEELWGNYRTDGGDYEWRIHGTIRGGTVSWGFTEAIREKEPRFLVGNAWVAGRYDEQSMNVEFTHPVYKSRAAMTLRPVP